MIILDTNVVSEIWKPEPSLAVVEWMDRHPKRVLFLTSISEAEILFGLQLMAVGKRRAHFERFFEKEVLGTLSQGVLVFDSAAAKAYAMISAKRRSIGRPMAQADAMIAAIVAVHGATLATRNTKDFVHCGIELVNPWES